MQIHYKKSDIFIPESYDNKKQPEGEQVKFYHGFVTTAQRKEFVYVEPHTQGKVTILTSMYKEEMNEDEQVKMLEKNDRKIIQDGDGIARAITTKIENLEMVDDETKKVHKIDTIEKFYNAPDAFPLFAAEYRAYCLGLSARADTKN